jgi:hypothetical protein
MTESGAQIISWWRNITPRQLLRIFGEAVAWVWFLLAGVGGFGLILIQGPLPLTHGWYAMFSGLAWCPATAWVLKRYANIELSYWTRFAIAAIIMLAGRLALIVKIWPFG